jgi:NADH-quinone oxidoreductase subunit N
VISSLIRALTDRLHGDVFLFLPELELLLFAAGILLIDHWMATKEKYWNPALAMAGVCFSGYTLWMLRARVAVEGELVGFRATLIVDAFFLFFAALVLAVLALVILLSAGYRQIPAEREAKYFALLLAATIGMMVMLSGIDLILSLLGIEIMALTCYRAMRITNPDSQSSRAALRYFATSGFATAILVGAFAALYRIAASTNIGRIGQMLDRRAQLTAAPGHSDWFVIFTVTSILAGLLLKLAALRLPGGAPEPVQSTPAASFVNAAAAASSVALLLRLLTVLFGASHDTWMRPLTGLAVVLLASGAQAAVWRANLTRLLVCGALANLGFVLLGLVAGNETALTGIVYYLAVYSLMAVGAFAVLAVLADNSQPTESPADLRGLYQRSPALAILTTVFLFALAGLPPLAGFMAKYMIMQSLFEARHRYLVAIAALSLIVGICTSLYAAVQTWRKSPQPLPRLTINSARAVVLTVAAFASIVAGLYPEPFLRLARYAFGS